MTLQEQIDALAEIEKTHTLAMNLCKDLIDPEMFGFAVNAEIRNRAREVFGIKERE